MVSRHSREIYCAHPTSYHSHQGELVQAKKECMEKLEETVLNHDLADGEIRDGSPLAKAVQMATEAQAKAKSGVE